ncbi:MAG: type II secretion system ATPase GspE [Thermacetogeniaceae bacterium]
MAVVPTKRLLGEVLVERGIITRKQLERALQVQAETGGLLGRILIELGMITEGELSEALGVEGPSSVSIQPDPGLLRAIPQQLLRKHKIIPLRVEGNKLHVAIADAYNVVALDDLRLLTGYEVEVVKTTEKEIDELIEKRFGPTVVEDAFIEFEEESNGDETPRVEDKAAVDAPVIRLVNSLLLRAIEENASDIHIEPFEDHVLVRFRVDGMLRHVTRIPRRMSNAVVSRVKVMANLDIAERRLPQDGRIPLKLLHYDIDLRVSTVPTIFGEKVVIRIFNKENFKRLTIDALGFSDYNLRQVTNFLKSSYGMVLVTGPTGSGKTTTLYTALKALNSIEKNIITVEDPVEYVLEGVNQIQVNAKTGATFSTYLRSILRQDPDVIMVGEIRDLETAEIAVRSATTGHLVLSTLHTNDAPGALIRLIDMGVEPFMVASSVIGVIAQRLVRRICPACREPYRPTEAELSFAGVKSADGFFIGKGCERCGYTGYHGRIAIHEVLVVKPALQRLILKRASIEELREAALQGGMVPLKDDGIAKALQGITTIREVMRVTFGGKTDEYA